MGETGFAAYDLTTRKLTFYDYSGKLLYQLAVEVADLLWNGHVGFQQNGLWGIATPEGIQHEAVYTDVTTQFDEMYILEKGSDITIVGYDGTPIVNEPIQAWRQDTEGVEVTTASGEYVINFDGVLCVRPSSIYHTHGNYFFDWKTKSLYTADGTKIGEKCVHYSEDFREFIGYTDVNTGEKYLLRMSTGEQYNIERMSLQGGELVLDGVNMGRGLVFIYRDTDGKLYFSAATEEHGFTDLKVPVDESWDLDDTLYAFRIAYSLGGRTVEKVTRSDGKTVEQVVKYDRVTGQRHMLYEAANISDVGNGYYVAIDDFGSLSNYTNFIKTTGFRVVFV